MNAFSATPIIPQTVTVQIEFNGEGENITKSITYRPGLTALEALMYVAKIQTHPAGDYVFVDIINDVKNSKEKNAWYFTINEIPSKKLAIDRKLKADDVVCWIYKENVCSRTIKK
jgi:hypothetical protein